MGDYSARINENLEAPDGTRPRLYMVPRGIAAPKKLAAAMLNLASAQSVILEYSCYSYQRYGAPYWLVRALSRWKASQPGRRLVTMFHELYATGMPWSTAFWTSAPQQYVSWRLANLSDAAITTTERQARILRGWSPNLEVAILPVPSNVGEFSGPLPSGREPILIAFGQEGTRRRLYLDNAESWGQIRRMFPQAVIHEVGRPTGLPVTELTGLACKAYGGLPNPAISELFKKAQFGLLDYTRSTLDKSGVFASYCAYGLVSIVFRHSTPASSALREGEHFLTPHFEELPAAALAGIAANAHAWYRQHDVALHARTLNEFLAPSGGSRSRPARGSRINP